MKRVLWLVRKDLWRFFADRNGALLTITMPVILAAMLGMLFAPPDLDPAVELLVANEDGGDAAARLVRSLVDDDAVEVVEVTREEAEDRLRRGRASVALVLPQRASELLEPLALMGGPRPEGLELELLFDPSKASESQIVSGLIQKHIIQTAAAEVSKPDKLKGWFQQMALLVRVGTLLTGSDPQKQAWLGFADSGVELAEAMEADGVGQGGDDDGATVSLGLPLATKEVKAEGLLSGYNSYAHNFAGMLCMFLLFWAQDAAKELVAEREQGSLTRLRMSALSAGQVMAGRALSAMAIATVITAAVYAVGILVFDVEVLGPIGGFVMVCLAQAFFAAGFALFLAGIGRTERQISNLGTFLILMLSFLGGAWLPSFLMPDWLQGVTPALPTFWATDGLAAMTWRGLDLQAALVPTGVLVGYGIVLGAIGVRTFSWRD